MPKTDSDKLSFPVKIISFHNFKLKYWEHKYISKKKLQKSDKNIGICHISLKSKTSKSCVIIIWHYCYIIFGKII